MLLNTWISAAKRYFASATPNRRTSPGGGRSRSRTEQLENRSLLTALVINPDNQGMFTDAASGRLEIDNADLAGKDALVIEGITVTSTSGDAIRINLSNIALKRLSMESIRVTAYGLNAADSGFDIDLTNVTTLHTISIEDSQISTGATVATNALGIDLSLSNTDVEALTVDDSSFHGIRINAAAGSAIAQSLISENTIVAKSNFEGILLTTTGGSTANNFRVERNYQVSSPNRDFVKIDASGTPMSGLRIADNTIGTDPQRSGLVFRAEGDTFAQPFTLRNSSTPNPDPTKNEKLQTFVLNLSDIGLKFDTSTTTGRPFTPIINGATGIAVTSAVVSPDKSTLTVDFTGFDPGEQIQFRIDVDLVGETPAANSSIFGDDLIGADITGTFTGNGTRTVTGRMVGDPDQITASEFAIGPGVTGNVNGINLLFSNAPVSQLAVTGNNITGASSNGLLLDADTHSNVSGVISNNVLTASARDGIHFDLADSDFTGAVLDNRIVNSGGYGIAMLPRVSRSGLIQAVVDSNPVVITSANHGLVTGDQIVIQGMVNHNTNIAHPGNGIRTITRIDGNRFSLNGVNGTAAGVLYEGGGAWYKPEFQLDGTPKGLVNIDLQTTAPTGTITALTNAAPIVVTSANHGLATGQKVRVSNVRGNTAANGVFTITRLSADTFRLNGSTGNGAYDISEGYGSWTANVVETTSASGNAVITSTAHGLKSGDQIRITGVQGNTAANGTFVVAVLTPNTFRLQKIVVEVDANGNPLRDASGRKITHIEQVQSSGAFAGGGNWVKLEQAVTGGGILPQRMSGNEITGNELGGIYVDLATGTAFQGDIVGNDISDNKGIGVQVRSHSFGIGRDPVINAANPQALPGLQDVSFNVNIGTGAPGDGNFLNGNKFAGIAIEALDYGSGSFEIHGNSISDTKTSDVGDTTAVYHGEGIAVRLAKDLFNTDAVSLLAKSIIDGNTIGVDNQGNQGNGLLFTMSDRTRIQDLDVTNNTFLNNAADGFHFDRTEDANLSNVVIRKNRATNNANDGISLSATNTSRDEIDFIIGENIIDSNDIYGIRLEVSTDARVNVDLSQNSIMGNGDNISAANRLLADDELRGFHPDDVTGSGVGNLGAGGGIGILAFQQAALTINGSDNQITNNVGDGVSVDAFNVFDSLKLNMNMANSSFSGNSLTGFRSHGMSFGTLVWTANQFNDNGEDGVRIVSIDDKQDYYERKVGGQDISVLAMRNHFDSNGANGAKLGQGVSGAFGDGTDTNANYFDSNSQDGLKITQSAGPYLAGRNSTVAGSNFAYQARRHVGTNRNYFRNNLGDGIDIGHFVLTENTGSLELGDEVISDTHIAINSAIITGNGGDGVEYLADSRTQVSPVSGGGQENVTFLHNSSLSVSHSRISGNAKRGIDILNRTAEDSAVTITNNQIFSNKAEAIYVLNTAAREQLQNSSLDPLAVYVETTTRSNEGVIFFSTDPKERQEVFDINPNIELRVRDNVIESNGSQTAKSLVPTTSSAFTNDLAALPSPDWTHNYQQINGTLGGLVIRVGAVDSAGRFTRFGTGNPARPIPPETAVENYLTFTANPNWELGLSGIDAEVVNNDFNGNVGADVYVDAFTSQMPRKTIMEWGTGPTGSRMRWREDGYRDPLARLNMVFRGNEGNSLDVTNGFSFLDNDEQDYKRRWTDPSKTPPGVFPIGNSLFRFRNQQRTLGNGFDNFGSFDMEDYYQQIYQVGTPPVFVGNWSYDGTGTSSFRVESDFDTGTFEQTNTTLGFSDFFGTTKIGVAVPETKWDTGRNTPGFTGVTPWSLDRGDVFNVRTGQNAIAADSLEENDSFIGATSLGTYSGGTLSVNSRAVNNTLSLHSKRDRDYYSFVSNVTGTISVNAANTDATGDDLVYMLYEVDSTRDTEERPVTEYRASNGNANFVVASASGTGVLTAAVQAGKTYYVEVFSDESENVVDSSVLSSDPLANAGKLAKFRYGTVRTYNLSINSPPVPAPAPAPRFAGAQSVVGQGAGSGAAQQGSTGFLAVPAAAPISLPGAPTPSFVAVSPDPRSTAVSDVTLTFNEDVTGVDLTDFRLMRGATQIPLTAAAGVTVTRVSATEYSLDLGSVSGTSGTYTLSLTATGSGIKDSTNTDLVLNATESWTVTNTVNVFTDSRDATIGDGDAKDGNGFVSLRAAVMESNATAGDDVITLQTGTYTLTLGGRGEDDAATGDLDIRGNVTIRGVSPRATTISGGDLDRIFHILQGGALTLENLTVRFGEEFDGGAIFNAGALTLNNVNVIDSEAFNQGGGIYNVGTLNARNSSISRNVAGSRGGGVNNRSSATYVNTTISSNFAGSRGGGVFNEQSGIEPTSGAQLTSSSSMINVTVANNQAGAQGGGIALEQNATPNASDAILTLGNSIISGNTAGATSNKGSDLLGKLRNLAGTDSSSLGNNLIGIVDTRESAGLVLSDLSGTQSAPLGTGIQGLTNVGGNGAGDGALYHPLLPGSRAVDKGNNQLFPLSNQPVPPATRDDQLGVELDQTGRPRLINGDTDAIYTIDIGAAEYFVSKPVAVITATPNPAGSGETVTFSGGDTHSTKLFRVVQWEWDFDYDGVPANFQVQATGRNVTRTFTANRRVGLRVTDNQVPAQTTIGFVDITIGSPTKPVLQRPFTITTDDRPLFRWTGGTNRFTLEVRRLNANNTPGTVVLTQSNITGLTFESTTTSLTPGKYVATVRAFNASGVGASTLSDPYIFEVKEFTLAAPGLTTFDQTPIFIWTRIPDTSRYEFQVDRVSAPAATRVLANSNVATNSFQSTAPLGAGTFSWMVRAYDSDGNVGKWSAAKQFVIVQPRILTPLASTLDTTPTFTWTNGGTGTVRYELQVDRVGGATKVIYLTNLTTTSYTPTVPLANGTYKVWVRAIGSTGEPGLWSAAKQFRMDYTTGPNLIKPTGTVTVLRPEFEWEAIDSTRSYELLVENTTVTPATTVYRVTNIPHVNGATSIKYTHPTINLPAGTFRWTVRATSLTNIQTAFTTARTFTVPAPTITNPTAANNSANPVTTNVPEFRWTGVSQFVKYEIIVFSVDRNRVEFDNLNVTGTSFTQRALDGSPLPLSDGNYTVKVRGVDAAGNKSPYSTTVAFTIRATLGQGPQNLNQTFNGTTGARTFTWSAVANAARYEVIVKRITTSGQPIVINGTTTTNTTSFTSSIALSSGTYRWWVRGISSNNVPGPWSQPREFTVVQDSTSPAPEHLNLIDGVLTDETTDSPVVIGQPVFVARSIIESDFSQISVHPAGLTVQVSPERLQELRAEQVAKSISSSTEQEIGIDEMMQELAGGGWSSDLTAEGGILTAVTSAAVTSAVSGTEITPVQPAPIDDSASSGSGSLGATGVVTGLMAAAFGGRFRRTSRRNEKRMDD